MIRKMSSKGSDSKNLVWLVYQRVTLSIRPTRLIHVKHEEFGCISVLKRVISDSLKWYLGEWPDIIDIGLFKKKTKWKSWSGVVSKMFSVSENVFNTDVSMARWHTLRLAVPDTPHSTVRVHQNLHQPKPPTRPDESLHFQLEMSNTWHGCPSLVLVCRD